MKIPELSYLILNTFEDLRKKDFFKSQEILKGLSFSDIFLSDYPSFRGAIANFIPGKEGDINHTYLHDMLCGDNARKEAFKELNFFPKNMVIHYDFNFDTALNRGLEMNSLKSVNLLIKFIFEERHTSHY